MRWIALLLPLVGVVMLFPAAASEEPSPGPGPEMLAVAQALRAALPKLDPAVTYSLEPAPGALTVSYRTRTFSVHGQSKAGEWTERARQETGPDYRGFRLVVSVDALKGPHQIVLPQVLRGPYWTSDCELTPLPAGGKRLYWVLSYGSRTDEKTLRIIRRTLRSLGGKTVTDGVRRGVFRLPDPRDRTELESAGR